MTYLSPKLFMGIKNAKMVGQKFCQNRSILHRFRDKCDFAFYAEIQDGRQKWWENDF